MKSIIIAATLAILCSSCVATRGDLQVLHDQWQASLEAVSEAEAGDREAALQAAQEDLEDAFAAVEAEMGARIEAVAEKLAKGPQGWGELLASMGATAGATALGLNTWRNQTRRRELEPLRHTLPQ